MQGFHAGFLGEEPIALILRWTYCSGDALSRCKEEVLGVSSVLPFCGCVLLSCQSVLRGRVKMTSPHSHLWSGDFVPTALQEVLT